MEQRRGCIFCDCFNIVVHRKCYYQITFDGAKNFCLFYRGLRFYSASDTQYPHEILIVTN